jgi:Leucine-rich repeat (LRR) protein
MKNHFLYIVLLLSLLTKAQTVTIPDTNFKAKLLSATPSNQIAKDLSGTYFKIDANNDGQIQTSEANQVSFLDVSTTQITSLQGIANFTQLTILNCANNNLSQLDISALTLLQRLDCGNNLLNNLSVFAASLHILNCASNDLSTFDFNSLTNLTTLDCSSNSLGLVDVSAMTSLQTLICNDDQLTALDISTLPQLTHLDCGNNAMTSIDLPTLSQLNYLAINDNMFTNLNVASLTQLHTLYCMNNQISNLNITNLSNLIDLNCGTNALTGLNLAGLTAIQKLNCESNQIATINVSNLVNLLELKCSNNSLTTLNVSNLTNLTTLNCDNNQLPSLNVQPLTALVNFNCSNNLLTALNVAPLLNLNFLHCDYNQLTSLNVNSLLNLTDLSCSNNLLTSLTLNPATLLVQLNCTNNQLASITVNNLTHLKFLLCDNNTLSSINTTGLSSLEQLSCTFNQLTTLNLSALTTLKTITCSNNQLASLTLGTLPLLNYLYCRNNQITSLDCSHLPKLIDIYCDFNQITTLDFSSSTNLISCGINDNPLTSLFIKNGSVDEFLMIYGLDSLQYICADEGQLESVQYAIDDNSLSNCHVNSYCSFSPGGPFYTIQGTTKYDENANGCDALDTAFPTLKLTFNNGSTIENLVANTSGAYLYNVQAGTYNVTPAIENPSYFTISPSSASVTFPTQTSPFAQNFCIEPNGTHADIEITLIPLDTAIPGFDVSYKVSYKNKGTHAQNGTVNITFNDGNSDFVSATPTPNSQATNSLSWSFINLQPFESREIVFVLNLNSQLESPAIQIGDTFHLTANVTANVDESPSDNTATLNQTVVNTSEANNKICLEGTKLEATAIGSYVHYKIKFENINTSIAQNIVVKDVIDTTKFDVNSLIPLSGTAPFITKITNTNQVEFIFENINLPFDDAHNDGYLIFKIKTKPSLVVGDTFSNTASIYFDYNSALATNSYSTDIIAPLSNTTFTESNTALFPNPAHNTVHIDLKNTSELLAQIAIYDVLGNLVMTKSNLTSNQTSLDITTLSKGVYVVEISTSTNHKLNKKLVIE